MREDRTTIVRVQTEWDAWQGAEVCICDLDDIHWFQPPGAPQEILYGHVWCDRIVAGTLPHRCDARSGPHRLQVCVLKKHVLESTYVELVRRGLQAIGVRSRHAPAAVLPRLAAVR